MGLGGVVQIRHCIPLSEERGVHLSPMHPLATGLLRSTTMLPVTPLNAKLRSQAKLGF